MDTDEMKLQADFWLNSFSGEIPVLNLPTDFPRPIIQDSEGDCFSIKLDDGLYQELKSMLLTRMLLCLWFLWLYIIYYCISIHNLMTLLLEL